MTDTDTLQTMREGVSRMRQFVENDRWHDAPWYEGAFTERFVSDVKQCKLFVDVGAEIGYYSYLALRYMPRGARIVAFEPDPLRNTALGELFSPHPQVELHAMAVSDINGTVTLNRPTGCYCATAADLGGEIDKSFTVETVRLDDLLSEQPVNMVKIDIEGAEANALLGMAGILRHQKPSLYLETHPWINLVYPDGLHTIESLLSSTGYRLWNCDFGSPVTTCRLLGSRFLACGPDASQPSRARLWPWLRVHGGLRARAFVRSVLRL
jgi:FkbM family methyltransferase